MIIQQLNEKLNRHLTYQEQDPNNPSLRLTIGLLKAQVLHHQQQLTDAITLLEQLILDHQINADIAGLLSLLHFDNQNTVKADLFAQKALSINPANYEGQLVQILLRALNNDATLDEINALIEINPQDSRVWFVLGTTQMRHMDFPTALQAFTQSTTIWPNFYDSWICAGWCYLLQNDLDKAEMAYQQASSIDQEAADGWNGLALVYALRNNMAEATKTLQKAEAINSDSFLAIITRIMIANQSNPEEAIEQFNSLFPDVGPEMNRIGDIGFSRIKNLTDSLDMFD